MKEIVAKNKSHLLQLVEKYKNEPDLNFIDTSNVTNMSYLFFNATSFDQDISGWNVSNVTNMPYMFDKCKHKYEVHGCGDHNRTLYLNHIDLSKVHIGCFVGTQKEGIEAISKKYKGNNKKDYIDKVNRLFAMI